MDFRNNPVKNGGTSQLGEATSLNLKHIAVQATVTALIATAIKTVTDLLIGGEAKKTTIHVEVDSPDKPKVPAYAPPSPSMGEHLRSQLVAMMQETAVLKSQAHAAEMKAVKAEKASQERPKDSGLTEKASRLRIDADKLAKALSLKLAAIDAFNAFKKSE